MKNFIGDRSSNISRKETIHRCSRGLYSLSNVRRQFGDDEDTPEGRHQRPDDIQQDVKKAVKSLEADLFEDIGRAIHPLAKKTPLLPNLKESKDLKNFIKYLENAVGVAVVESTLPTP